MNEPPILTFDRYTAETALCIWEAILENHLDMIPTWGGAWASRHLAIDLAPHCDAAWDEEKDISHLDYLTDTFDWEYVPTWLEGLIAKGSTSTAMLANAPTHRAGP